MAEITVEFDLRLPSQEAPAIIKTLQSNKQVSMDNLLDHYGELGESVRAILAEPGNDWICEKFDIAQQLQPSAFNFKDTLAKIQYPHCD